MGEENDKLVEDIEYLRNQKRILEHELIQLEDEILYQDFGLYKPQYDFADLDQYKARLDEVRKSQKEMVIAGTAALCNRNWKVHGSEKAGRKFIAENTKGVIRTFNIECDICIDKVRFSNYENSKERILKSYETLNKLNETNEIVIAWDYYLLKTQELNLSYEYEKKKREFKEEQRVLREQKREEQRVLREIEEKRKEFEKEQAHYQNALKKLEEQLTVEKSEERKQVLLNRKDELVNNMADVDTALADLDYREANHRAGYVYIISNIGAFGDNVFKIGMTRRLDPEDRISELSGASVPFRFDVHAMIFSNDAPKLEAALHKAFADKKINLVNGRKEFFRVALDEIKEVIRENHDQTVDFVNLPEAQQYRETCMMRKTKSDE